MNVNFTPGASGLLFAAVVAARAASSWMVERLRGGNGGFSEPGRGGVMISVKCKPVIMVHIRRTRADLHRIALATRFGRECHVRNIVPPTRTNLLVVMICKGRRVRTIQRGVTRRIRMRRVVSAGLVVADVAVLWVDKKSVSSSNGSKSTLHR